MKTAKGKDLDISKDVAENDMTPLAHYTRARGLAKELMNISDCGRLLDMSPNGCDVSLDGQATVSSQSYRGRSSCHCTDIMQEAVHPRLLEGLGL